MQRQSRFAIVAIVVFACLATNARCQSLDSILNATDKTNLEILATHTLQKIRDADRAEKEPRVLVIDFFLGSPGVSSSLGTLQIAFPNPSRTLQERLRLSIERILLNI
jgi:hypothetical protein